MTTKITTIYQTNHCFIYRSVTCTIDSIVRCHQRQYVIYTSLLSYNKYSPTFLGRWGRCMFNVHFSKSGEKNEKYYLYSQYRQVCTKHRPCWKYWSHDRFSLKWRNCIEYISLWTGTELTTWSHIYCRMGEIVVQGLNSDQKPNIINVGSYPDTYSKGYGSKRHMCRTSFFFFFRGGGRFNCQKKSYTIKSGCRDICKMSESAIDTKTV